MKHHFKSMFNRYTKYIFGLYTFWEIGLGELSKKWSNLAVLFYQGLYIHKMHG